MAEIRTPLAPADAAAESEGVEAATSARRWPDAQLPLWDWRAALASLFQTTFAFCFSMKEGMLLLSGLLLVSAFFWLYTLALQPWAPSAIGLSTLTIAIMLTNSALAAAAALRKSEREALALVLSFGAMLVLLLLDLATNSPATCSNEDVLDAHPLGACAAHRAKPAAGVQRAGCAHTMQRGPQTARPSAALGRPVHAQASSCRTCCGRRMRASS